jgi:hypothetical protein
MYRLPFGILLVIATVAGCSSKDAPAGPAAGGSAGAAGAGGGAAGAGGDTAGAGGDIAGVGGDTSGVAGNTAGGSGAPACVTGATGPTAFPFAVDEFFTASGWMGDFSGISLTSACTHPASAGPALARAKCWDVKYTPSADGGPSWAGVDWQFPKDNWGTVDGLAIPAGATKVEFVAWGDTGTEVVHFAVGYGPGSLDNFQAKLMSQTLTTAPARYAVDMTGQQYTCSSVRMGFGWIVSAAAAMSFHISDIEWK